MNPKTAETIVDLLMNNMAIFLKLTLPVVAIVSGIIFIIYQRFVLPSLKESKQKYKEQNEKLEKEKLTHDKLISDMNAEKEKEISVLTNKNDKLEVQNIALKKNFEEAIHTQQQYEHKISNLMNELSQYRIAGKNEVLLSSFIDDNLPNIKGGIMLFGGKLILPPLNEKWIKVSHGDGSQGTFKGGDLGIFHKLSKVSWPSIEKGLRKTLQFNRDHPPNIWTTAECSVDDEDKDVFPYLQVSLISNAEAEELVRSVREDIEGVKKNILNDAKDILSRCGVDTAFDTTIEQYKDKSEKETILWKLINSVEEQDWWLRLLIEEANRIIEDWKENSTEKIETIIKIMIPNMENLKLSQRNIIEIFKRVKQDWLNNKNHKINELIKTVLPPDDDLIFTKEDVEDLLKIIGEDTEDETEKKEKEVIKAIHAKNSLFKNVDSYEKILEELKTLIKQYIETPYYMFMNCVKSLSKMSPETGLLIGRMLYYVFSVSNGGKVDIQQLSSSYEGSYARVRTEKEFEDNGKKQKIVFNDHILILATKSDFCLVHAHIPLHSIEMYGLHIEIQNWIKNIRLALLK